MIRTSYFNLRSCVALLECCIMVGAAGCGARAPERAGVSQAPPPAPARNPQSTERTPEEVFREFLAGVMTSDEEVIRRTSIDRPGIEVLWAEDPDGSKPRPPGLMESLILAKMPITRLKVGDEISFMTPQGMARRVITENEVNDGKVFLRIPEDPLCHVVIRLDGKWLVEPGALIAARQAGRAHRQNPAPRNRSAGPAVST